MEIIYTFYFFCIFEKVIKKTIDILLLARPQNPSSFPVVQDWHHLTVQRHVVAYKLYVGFSCKRGKSDGSLVHVESY